MGNVTLTYTCRTSGTQTIGECEAKVNQFQMDAQSKMAGAKCSVEKVLVASPKGVFHELQAVCVGSAKDEAPAAPQDSGGEVRLTRSCSTTAEKTLQRCEEEMNSFQLEDALSGLENPVCSVQKDNILSPRGESYELNAVCVGKAKARGSAETGATGGELMLRKSCSASGDDALDKCEEEINSFQTGYAMSKLKNLNCSVKWADVPSPRGLSYYIEAICKGIPEK